MAITRTQQARQMLKKGTNPVVQGGVDNYLGKQPQVIAPRKWQSGPNKPPTELAYITEAEKKLLLKEDIHGSLKDGPNKGPAGIMSLDSFGDIGGAGAAGVDTEAGGGAMEGRGFSGRGPSETQSAFDARVRNQKEIMQKAEQRQAEALGFRERKNIIDRARPGRFGFNPLATLLGFINPVLGFATRGIMGIPNVARKFKSSNTLVDFLNKLKTPAGTTTDQDDTTLLDQVDSDLPFARSYLQQLQSKMPPPVVTDTDMSLAPDFGLLEVPGVQITPEQRQLIEDEQVGDIRDIMAADGGMIGGGIMDAAGRQNYFLGKLVKKATRAVKKIVKSPVGKLGIGAALAFSPFGKEKLLPFIMKNKELAAAAGLIAAPFIFGQEEQQQQTGFTGPVGGQIDSRAYTDPYGVLYTAFRADGSPKEGEKGNMKVAGYLDPMSEKNDMAMEMFRKRLEDLTEEELELLDEEIQRLRSKFLAEGGSTEKEPVAKKTMPLLDMGGQEMDLRAEGGFVPIGRMEKADDVPARLSKNEFVFTADAVRNAGDGDVDKGAEVMYNMMKNLEAGGDVSKESQGLEGARKMFQTSQRLGEVV